MQFACPGLLNTLESGATVVVPSPFLAAVISHNFASTRLADGAATWAQPEILTASTWLKLAWTKARYATPDLPVMLSPSQEELLWQQIIDQHTPGLFDSRNTARLARRAASLIEEWQIPLDQETWSMHGDGQQFKLWLAALRTKCRQDGWTTESALWRSPVKWEGKVVFAGFQQASPALRSIQRALGMSATFLALESFAPAVADRVYSANDFADELEHLARACRAAFEHQPATSVGVFVPDLATHRKLVVRVFEQIFYPRESVLRPGSTWQRSGSVFHINAGAPLSDDPLIAGARLLLRLAGNRVPIGDAGAILRSPWITGAASERNARALADVALRRSRELDVTLNDLERNAKACPNLQNCFRHVRDVVRAKPIRADFSVWAEMFGDVLGALKWPGDVELTNHEREIVEAWKEKLSRLASLTLISNQVSMDEALRHLDSLLEDRAADIGDFFSPIQIIDAGDAHGLRFDQTFVAGLSEGQSLLRRGLSPLIPLQLQRACGIPGATAGGLHEQTRQAVEDLFSSAPRISATYCDRLLPAVAPYVSGAKTAWARWEGATAKQSFEAVTLEKLADSNAPAYEGDGHSLGGTGLIKDQSNCPFRAFAARRLNARSLEDGSFGMDNRERGSFAHTALKIVWDELKSQHKLRGYVLLGALVQDAVRSAIRNQDAGPLRQQLSLAEIERLTRVISDWLGVESERKIPFTVETTEQKRELKIAGLHLDIRIDRIDRLPNGKAVLIDYKSGEPKAGDLNGERPKEPQVLAYAATMPDEVDGFFFGQLKPREPKLVGFAREKHIERQQSFPKDLTWREYLDDRIEVVERLAQSFVVGEAAVDPLKGACTFCDIGPFCRINEINAGKRESGNDD